MLEGMKNNGSALKFATDDMKSDRDLVIQAIR
jgi:hypothetical protein